MLEIGPELFQIKGFDVIEVGHAVRIAHRDARHDVSPAVNDQRSIDDLAVGINGNLASLENWLAHIHLDQVADDPGANNTG
jgi:hypothetical protein